jgi:hypothetical protein
MAGSTSTFYPLSIYNNSTHILFRIAKICLILQDYLQCCYFIKTHQPYEKLALQRSTTNNTTTQTTTRQKTPVAYAFSFLRSPNTVKQYPRRLQLFFEFVGLQGDNLEQQGQAFIDEVRKGRH